MRTLIVLGCALFAGCSGSLTPSQLEPPAAVLLVPPPRLVDYKKGDDLVQKNADLRRAYISQTDRYRRLQRWVKTVLKR